MKRSILFSTVVAALFWLGGRRVSDRPPEFHPVQAPHRLPQPVTPKVSATASAHASAPTIESHPLVHFDRPGALHSFSQSGLRAAFDVYFSLIGETQARYPYARSGFDTEENSRLAYETVLHPRYAEKEFEAIVFAIEHLNHSELPASVRRREELAGLLVAQIENAPTSLHRDLRAADLSTLLEGKRADRETIAQLYRATRDRTAKSALGMALQKLREKS